METHFAIDPKYHGGHSLRVSQGKYTVFLVLRLRLRRGRTRHDTCRTNWPDKNPQNAWENVCDGAIPSHHCGLNNSKSGDVAGASIWTNFETYNGGRAM